MQRTSRIEAQSQDALVRDAICRQLVQGREQKSKSNGSPLFEHQRGLEGDRERFAQKLVVHAQRPRRGPMRFDVAGKVRG